VDGHATEPLRPGAVSASLTATNIVDRAAVAEALRLAVGRLGGRPARVALVVPDAVAKVSLVRFDRVPAQREDLDQLVRWQVRKTAPFPVEDASVTYTPGAGIEGGGREFIVAMARRDIVAEYEAVCADAGVDAGLIDLATFSVVNLCLASGRTPSADWLIVHVRPESTSLVIMRGEHAIFYRTRAEEDGEALGDLVHQTAMYYQDRLSGTGFSRVLLGGSGRDPGEIDAARRSLEERLGGDVESIDPTAAAPLSDRIAVSPGLADVVSPMVGILLRARSETVAA
jgi:type IV pilus assembly protein PilM